MKKFERMLLACDMDGTLLDSQRKVSVKNQQAIQYFTEQGGLFSLATGRAPGAAQPYFDELSINAPYSLLNGALIFDKQHNILSCAGMPEKTKELINAAVSKFPEIGCEIFDSENIYIRQMSEVTETHLKTLNLSYQPIMQDELTDTSSWCKINLTGTPKILGLVRAFLQPYADEFCMASSMPMFLEITEKSVHKGAALQKIAAYCGIPNNRIYAIGDSFNDEMMLRMAYKGFAPQNADQGILEIADIVVRNHDCDAVAAAIEWLDNMETRPGRTK
ncbi:HAD family hydrolase [Agathobaculum sp.]|uniref:HAD family hydrolase n=1 Tax=Agathobaculum sp. TaxID=2048138 RepID=UPI002A80E7C9|nr:HAD family hydrolase [Agathobaculum sp.]MDY3618087.1 HAD family hydrolase [Agathobaculum sp.]